MNIHPKGVHRERSGEYKVCQQCATIETQVAFRDDETKETIFEPFCSRCAMKTLATTGKWAKYTRRKQKGLVF